MKKIEIDIKRSGKAVTVIVRQMDESLRGSGLICKCYGMDFVSKNIPGIAKNKISLHGKIKEFDSRANTLDFPSLNAAVLFRNRLELAICRANKHLKEKEKRKKLSKEVCVFVFRNKTNLTVRLLNVPEKAFFKNGIFLNSGFLFKTRNFAIYSGDRFCFDANGFVLCSENKDIKKMKMTNRFANEEVAIKTEKRLLYSIGQFNKQLNGGKINE